MTSQQDDITALLQGMKSSVSAFEQTKDRALLQQIDSDFQRFAQLATLFLIAERDSYYGYFLMSMTFRTNYAVSSIAGIRLGEYPPVFETNPLILLKYSLKEILYIFCHEIDHVVFNHPAEMVKSNPEGSPELFELFNYAADASVNDMLNNEIKQGKQFMRAPKGIVTSEVIKTKFQLPFVLPMESYQYYFDLIKHCEDMLGDQQQDGIAPIPGGEPGGKGNGDEREGEGENANDSSQGDPADADNVVTAADATGNISDHAWITAAENGEPASESAEAMAEAVKELLNEVNDYFKPIKQKYIDNGQINPKSLGTDAQALVYKVPGGMLSNMIANLTDMKAMDKFDAALAEIPQVRADMGYPPLVTPLSQMVGNQAVTNVLVGERYRQISKEIQNYIKGEYGIAPAPVSEALQKKVLGEGGKPVDCRIEDQKRTGQEFEDAKKALGDLARSEEDIMSYICYPDQTVKFLENRKAQEENEAVYTIEAM